MQNNNYRRVNPLFLYVVISIMLFSLQACMAERSIICNSEPDQGRYVSERVSAYPQDNYLENRQIFLNKAGMAVKPGDDKLLSGAGHGEALMLAAIRYATSKVPGELKHLESRLADRDFFERLDGVGYSGTYASMRLAAVLGVLIDNNHLYAQNIITGLIYNPVMQTDLLRIQLLVHVLSEISSPSVQVLDYWQKLSQGDSPLSFDVMQALIFNQSNGAMALLLELFADPGHSSQSKLDWMRQLILPRRNDEAILKSCNILLKKNLDQELRPALIEVLFDYKPEQWYIGTDGNPMPPSSDSISLEAEKILRDIAAYALDNISLSEDLRYTIRQHGY